jgi:hypothetical protein
MKRLVLTLLAMGLLVVGDTTAWALTVMRACPGKCPFCP